VAAVWASAKILEFDYAGIEQVLMGWFFQSARYIRIAKLGTHAIVASTVLHRQTPRIWSPADLSLPDKEIAAYLKTIKKTEDEAVGLVYDQCKRTVHGTAYGLTTHGMVRNFPTIFPTLKVAEETQRIYFDVAPEVPEFHTSVRHTAHQQKYLGGAATYQYLPAERKVIGHPYGYKLWLWSVVAYERLNPGQLLWRQKRKLPTIEINGIWYGITLGEDAKRAAAFYPQGTARGVLTDACFPLFDPEDPLAESCYIGDCYFGRTPLRAPIHDSLLIEAPTRMVDRIIERVCRAMMRPIDAMPCPPEWGMGEYLTVGVDGKIGADWGSMVGLDLPRYEDLEIASDSPYTPAEDEDEDDVLDLETRIA